MKISFNWLRELVELKPGVTADSVAERLTLAGLEVESIERRGRDVRGVVVAEVRGARPHPTADKLSIVRLSAGGPEAEVVCGAPNVPEPGGKVAWAAPGAALPGGLEVGRKEIRGFSSPGMICSEVELGIGDQGDGILILAPSATPGADLMGLLGVLDEVLEVNVTPNRADALSHLGIAREVAALFGTRVRVPAPDEVPGAPFPAGHAFDVEIRDPLGCPRYAARVVTEVKVGPAPLAMRVRLAACGVRSISNVVDATNYVMLETGHPLHAFDLDKLSGTISVRRAGRAERMTTLDGVDRGLQESDLVIADGRGPVALAGVMGGATSEVGPGTTAVMLETATFDPRSIRRTARRLALHSEASHRFERGVDANGVPHASLRAAAMIARLSGGRLSGDVVDRYPQPQHPRRVPLSRGGLDRLAGFPISLDTAAERLAAIEIESERTGQDTLLVTVPTFRPDVTIEEDLVEEVMRLVGYDRAPVRLPAGGRAPAPSPESLADRARDALASLGLHEVATWGFVPRPWLLALVGGQRNLPLGDGVVVKNPISADYEVMRTSLLPGLIDAARRNVARGVSDVALFEVGTPSCCARPTPRSRRSSPPAPPGSSSAAAPGGSSRGRPPTSSTPSGWSGSSWARSASASRPTPPPARRTCSTPAWPPRSSRARTAWWGPSGRSTPSSAARWGSTCRRSTSRCRWTSWPASGAGCAARRRRASRPSRATCRSGSRSPSPPTRSGGRWPGRGSRCCASSTSSRTSGIRSTPPRARRGCSGRSPTGPTTGRSPTPRPTPPTAASSPRSSVSSP
jgi:phenylalanyl-tRNA synthetase beta chain